MPISRYEIRNEYSLADPELYRAADKDDPEALLEGVAMAGLVGLLRQLGDLAEFAAEIFHDLHEEVMVTAARGHGLMIRVQQIEAEVPSIERAFLSQSDHSSLFYNAGVDWHPNLRLDQNLVTQGDLPRFVMDSYEECRGPPRLFLLDKFDVAGAGACLKRYTDPSFFKVETSGTTSLDGQREKKIRKAKKKGPRWRNGETPKVLPTSHAKLHQLFLEEPVENVVSNPGRHAKLKRRLNGFPFDSRTGKSYMEKVLRTPSPEHKMLDEVPVSSPVIFPAYDHDESDLKVFEAGPVSLHRESVERKRRPPSPPDRDGTMLNLSIYEPEEVSVDEKIREASDIPSTLDKVVGEKDKSIDGENKIEGSLAGYQSDDIASEIDNYVDAPSTMGSEMDTDSELRVKNDFSSYIKKQPFISDANENHLQSQSSDSQSTGDLIISDEGNTSSKKEISSSLSFDSQSTSAENLQLENISIGEFLSAGVSEMGPVDSSSNQKADDVDFSVDQHSKLMVSGDTCTSPDAVTNHRSDFEQPTSSFRSDGSVPTSAHSDSEVATQGRLREPKWDETVSTSDDEEKKTNPIIDPTCSPSASDSKLPSGDDSPRSSSGEPLVDETDDENVPSISIVSNILRHTTDNTVTISADLLHEDESGREDPDIFANISTTLHSCDVLYSDRNDSQKMSSIENPVPGKLDDEVPKLPETFQSDYTEIAHNGDNMMSTVLKGENLIDEVDSEHLDAFLDVPNRVPCTKETTFGKETVETSFANAQTVDVEDHHSNRAIEKQITSDNLIPSHLESSSDWLDAGLDAFDGNFIAEERKVNGTHELGTPISCKDVELQGAGIRNNVTPNDIAAPESSCSTPDDFKNPAGSLDTVENDGVTLYTSTTELQVTEISCSADPKSLKEVHILLNESDSRTDLSETGSMASPVPTVSDNSARDKVGLHKMVEDELEKKSILSESHMESGLVELDENCLSESHMELGIREEVGENEPNTLDSDTISNGHSKLEVSQTVPNSYLDLNAEISVDIVDTPQIQPPLEKNGLDTEEESQESRIENQLSDTSSLPVASLLPVASNIKDTLLQDKTEFPTNQLDQELPDSGELISDLSSPLPINHQQMLDHGYHIVDKKSASTFSNFNSPPLVSELPEPSNYDIDVSGYEDRFGSTFPPSNIFYEANQINLEELPPLPPLPPVQWRMGKLFSREISLPINVSSSHEEMNHSLIQIAPEITSKEEKVEYTSSSFEGTIVHETIDFPQMLRHASSTTEEEITKHKELNPREISQPITSADDVSSSPEEIQSLIQISRETASKEEEVEYTSSSLETTIVHETITLPPKLQHASCTTEGEIEKHNELFPPEISPPIASAGDVTSSTEENHFLIQIPSETASKEEKIEYTSSSSKANDLHETIDIPPKFENEPQQLVMPSSEGGFTLPAEEDGVANGNRTVKLPRPRNPLMDEVAALDKSKLRKVTERDIPQTQQVDERDSLLEQIRAKSFNLKPAVQSKPSIRGPNTNLRVAAILEKANAIRQAFAGSDDEDDEDSWSDS